MNFLIRKPKTKDDFLNYYHLRWKILRKPFNKKKGSEKDSKEFVSYHIMACNEKNKVVAVGRIHKDCNKKAQIRYMAVEKKYQRSEIGKSILEDLENYALSNSIETIYLNSRESALEFYIKNGYKIIEKSHLLFGNLQHWLMEKNIKK